MKIQQGDVVLIKITKEEFEKQFDNDNRWDKLRKESHTNKDDKCILALGEHTGHHHRFEKNKMNGFRAIAWNRKHGQVNEPIFLVIKENTLELQGDFPKLYHEEHNPVEVPPGYYKKEIVREFDHLLRDTRRVVD